MPIITGDSADSVIVGTADDDQIYGLEGNDTLYGGEGSDQLFGGIGNDSLVGDAGNDTLEGGAGADTLVGGAGIDTATYANSAAGVTVNLSTGVASGGAASDAKGDVLSWIENVIGSAFGDSLTGDANANLLFGGDGSDNIVAGAGNDTLDGGNGDDFLTGGLGADLLLGGAGNDTVYYSGSSQGVSVNLSTGVASGGEAAGDVLVEIENVNGSNYADTLVGTDGANFIVANGGNDTVYGGAGNDTIYGGFGNDLLIGGSGADRFDGGSSGLYDQDTVSYAGSKAGVSASLKTGMGSGGDAEGDVFVNVENLTGSSYDDVLIGNGLAYTDNVLDGGDGNDTLYGGGGTYDTLIGGNGNDTLYAEARDNFLEGGAGADSFYGNTAVYAFNAVSYLHSASGINVNLSTGEATGGEAEGDRFYGIAGILGSVHDDILIGTGDDNLIEGVEGNDYIFGGAGRDTLYANEYNGSTGSATVEGGAGGDYISVISARAFASYASSAEGVTIDLQNGIFAGGDAQGDTVYGVRNIIGSGNDDLLVGRQSVNTLIGGAGNDTIAGGGGSDVLAGDDGIDTVSYAGETNYSVWVDLSNNVVQKSVNLNDTISGFENAIGSEKSDRLIGTAGENVLVGGNGSDTLIGGAGADTLDGGHDADTASYAGSLVGVQVDLGTGIGLGGDAEGDRLYNVENVIGSAAGDVLIGTVAQNAIDAGAGDDTVIGGGGADTLFGGAGIDTLSYADSQLGVMIDLLRGQVEADGAASAGSFENAIGSAFNDRIYAGFVDGTHDGGTIDARAGDDVLIGGEQFIMSGPDGDIYLPGLSHNSVMIGGEGNDVYQVSRGSGIDTVVQAGINDADQTTDVVHFDVGISFDQLWFSHVGNDLTVSVIGEESSSVVLKDWYTDPTRQIDVFEVADGHHTLAAGNVQMLVDAMSVFDLPPIGQTALDPLIAQQLAPVFASSWV